MRPPLLALAALLVAGCAVEPTSPAPDRPPGGEEIPATFASEADYRQRREAVAARLAAAIGEATAAEVSACRAVPVGEQACGGPSAFAVYSAESADAGEVERLAGVLVALDVVANRQFEYASTCMLQAPPPLALRDGRCLADR